MAQPHMQRRPDIPPMSSAAQQGKGARVCKSSCHRFLGSHQECTFLTKSTPLLSKATWPHRGMAGMLVQAAKCARINSYREKGFYQHGRAGCFPSRLSNETDLIQSLVVGLRGFFLAWAGLSDSGCCARSLQEAKNNKKKLNKYKLRQANRSQKR